jgi:agmatinase
MLGLDPVKPFISSRLGDQFEKNAIHLIGFPFDGTTSYRPGSRFGPDGLRDASMNIEDYSPYLERDLSEVELIDLGNLVFHPSRWDIMSEQFESITKDLKLVEDQIRIITLGGEHSISEMPIKLHLTQYADLVLLHLDAHADLRDGYLEAKHSHASIIRRSLDYFTDQHQLIQYGIRSGTKEEFQYMKEHGTLRTSLESLVEELKTIDNKRPIYLTLDLDFFDPAYMPGTGTPETGGETFHSFIKILKILKDKNFIGADIVELAPTIDPTGNSSAMASKVTREVILALS